MIKPKLFFALIAGLTLSFPAAAKLYKWVDDNGVTHYGETIPPEYADKDREELNKYGRVIKSEEVMTPERRREKEQEEEKQREAEKAALEQQRHDRTLINTYSRSMRASICSIPTSRQPTNICFHCKMRLTATPGQTGKSPLL